MLTKLVYKHIQVAHGDKFIEKKVVGEKKVPNAKAVTDKVCSYTHNRLHMYIHKHTHIYTHTHNTFTHTHAPSKTPHVLHISANIVVTAIIKVYTIIAWIYCQYT
jgi:hypothetical protein